MPSSISSFETVTPHILAKRSGPFAMAIRVWLAVMVLLLAALETGTRFGFNRISRIESRTAADYQAARAILPAGANTPPTILLLGNSLLLEGVDYGRIQRAFMPGMNVVRFVIESTEYLDWYYGIRRLMAEGSRPSVIVLCLNPQHLISHRIRGDYSSYYLFRTADIPAVAREAQYDLTKTSSLFLARYSLFYAGRNNLRPFLLGRVAPPYEKLLHDLQAVPLPLPPADALEQQAEARLSRLKAAAESRGARFVFVLPPEFMPGETQIVKAGQKAGVPVLVPIHTGALPESEFSDGFHLNAHGARTFTDILAAQLHDLLSRTQNEPPI